MALNAHLIAYNIVSVTSAVIFFGTAFFTYINSPHKIANVTLSLTALATTVFFITNAIGVNLSDPYASRTVLMFNISTFFISIFNLHAVFALVGDEKRKRMLMVFIYIVGIVSSIIFIIRPDMFLLPSVPKMYFPNYYVAGELRWTIVVFIFLVIVPYITYLLLKAYRHATEQKVKRSYLLFTFAFLGAYIVAFIPNLLVYNIPVDPIWGMFCGLVFVVPFLYASIQYELFDIQVVAKQAFLFSLAVAAVGGIITLFNYSNVWIQQLWPAFPLWITAFVSAVLTVTLSILIWQKLRQDDLLKYEFITTVTHKFRTPLTHIKWSAESMSKSGMSQETNEQLNDIINSDAKLVELTNLLANVSEVEENSYRYCMEKTDISALVKDLTVSMGRQFQAKHFDMTIDISPSLMVNCDISRIQFVLQTLIENAVNYTHSGGKLTIKTFQGGKSAVFSIADNGIGVSASEMPLIFSKLYRSSKARSEDTEGMGIGLYITKEIVTRHKGKIWAESGGVGKGSTFSFSLPIYK